MELALAILATIGVATAVAWVIGTLLPPQQVSRREAILPASPLAVWELLIDYETHPQWHPEVESVELLDSASGRRRWRERHKNGEVDVVEEIERHIPHHLRWRFDETHRLFCAEWDLRLTPDGGGTRITALQRATIGNPLVRFASRLVLGKGSSLSLFIEAMREELARRARERLGRSVHAG